VCSTKFSAKSAAVFCKSINKSYKFSSYSMSTEYSKADKSKWGADNIKNDVPIHAS
jgi:hypothetical protein